MSPASGALTGRAYGARPRRRLGCLLLLVGLLSAALSSAADAQGDGQVIEVVQVEGVIDRTVAGYVRDVLAGAGDRDAEAVVLELDSPGAVGVPSEQLVDVVTASPVPVVVWVGPAGARATGAGAHLAYAGHVLAMAPGALLGAASPFDLGAAGPADDRVAAGALAALAELRGRDVGFAEAAEAGATVALAAPGLADTAEPATLPPWAAEATRVADPSELTASRTIDFAAASLPQVLAELDGVAVELAAPDGGAEARVLQADTAAAVVRFHNPGLVRQLLHTVANPTLAYLLVMAGALAILFEVFQPGFGVAGVSGVALFALGLYGLWILPVSWLAFALLLAGLALLAVDLAVGGLGPVTVAGAGAVAAGSWWLFTGPPVLQVPAWVIAGSVAFTALFFVVIMTVVLRAQGSQAAAGAEELVGQHGVVRSMLNPEGHVFVGGALWRARAPEGAGRVRTGTRVRVVGLDDRMTLQVALEPAEQPAGNH